jgi:hypothetical protein
MFSLSKFFLDWRQETRDNARTVQANQRVILANQCAILQQLAANDDRVANVQAAVDAISTSLAINEAVRFRIWAELDGNVTELQGDQMGFTLKDNQKVTLTISPVDARGNAATVDGAPVWATSDEAILIVTPTEDGLGATATAVGPLGNAQITVNADADLGEGTRPITGTLDVTVIGGDAVSLTISTGTPESQ